MSWGAGRGPFESKGKRKVILNEVSTRLQYSLPLGPKLPNFIDFLQLCFLFPLALCVLKDSELGLPSLGNVAC